jgi:uncharacterized BrkB/YihY/UPF0761 family membrane protein
MDEEQDQARRESFLLVFYLLAAGGAVFLLLFALCGGIVIYMAATALGIAAFALLHWWLWGHSLSRSVAAERDAEEEAPAPDAPPEDDPYRGRY